MILDDGFEFLLVVLEHDLLGEPFVKLNIELSKYSDFTKFCFDKFSNKLTLNQLGIFLRNLSRYIFRDIFIVSFIFFLFFFIWEFNALFSG